MNAARRTWLVVASLSLAAFAGCCCCGRFTGQLQQAAQDAANQTISSNNVMALCLAIIAQRDQNSGAWPESLDEVRANVPGYDQLIVNPVTKDNPGYEYVKPPDGADAATTVIIYQLRGGARDESLPKGYADGSVRADTPAANP
jgi:hypothetical protein